MNLPDDLREQYMSWRCLECGAEHADNILFCTACGAERVRAETDAAVPTGWWHRRSTDVVLVVAALVVCLGTLTGAAVKFFGLCTGTPIAAVIGALLMLNCLLAPALLLLALLRLCCSRALRLGHRVVVTVVILILNPMTWISTLTQASWAHRMNAADTNALVQACTYIIQHPNEFQKEYHSFKGLTGLPPAIACVKPVYVWIRDDAITIALIGGVDHRGWRFLCNDTERWALVSYDEYTQKVLLSNIVIATQTALGGQSDAAGTALP